MSRWSRGYERRVSIEFHVDRVPAPCCEAGADGPRVRRRCRLASGRRVHPARSSCNRRTIAKPSRSAPPIGLRSIDSGLTRRSSEGSRSPAPCFSPFRWSAGGRPAQVARAGAQLQRARGLSETEPQSRAGKLVVCPKIDARLLEGDSASLDLLDDLVGRLRPDERLRVGVAVLDVVLYGGDQLGDAGEAAPLQPFGGELPEPPLDQVQPRRAGGREVEVEAGVLGQPGDDVRVLVGAVVVDLCRCPENWTYADPAIMPTGGAREERSPCAADDFGGERAGEVGIITGFRGRRGGRPTVGSDPGERRRGW